MSTEGIIAILAGGQGTRLWPLSTAERPKQFVSLFEGRSMLQVTFDRVASMVGPESVLVVGDSLHQSLYLEQLPDLPEANLILEPKGRGTAAAVALTSVVCGRVHPGLPVATIPSDHIIPDPDEWVSSILTALRFARSSDHLVCLGAPPPVAGKKFGYIVAQRAIGGTEQHPVLAVERFVEKPDAETLAALISDGNCYRNMGVVAFRPDVLATEMLAHLPEVYRPLSAAPSDSDSALAKAYDDVPVQSIDEAVLQRSTSVAVTIGRMESIDAGDFVTLGDALGRDEDGNATSGQIVAVDASDNTVFADDVTVALVGVSGLVVVVEGNRVLVCPADESQQIKQIPKNN